jgi:hypothetical protein
MGFFGLLAFSRQPLIHRVYLARYIRSQGSSPLSVLSPAGLLCRLRQRALPGFHLQGFSLLQGRRSFRSPLPFCGLVPLADGSGFSVQAAALRIHSFLQSVRSGHRWLDGAIAVALLVFSSLGISPLACPLSSTGLGSVHDSPSGVFRLWLRQTEVGIFLLRDRLPLRGLFLSPSLFSKT